MSWRIVICVLTTAIAVVLSGCGTSEEASEISYWEVPTKYTSPEPWDQAAERARNAGADGTGDFFHTWAQGPVRSVRFEPKEKGSPIFINIGFDYPNPKRLTYIIWGADRELYRRLERTCEGHIVKVMGSLFAYYEDDKPPPIAQMEIDNFDWQWTGDDTPVQVID